MRSDFNVIVLGLSVGTFLVGLLLLNPWLLLAGAAGAIWTFLNW